MPFKSEAQRRLLWAKHPRIARRWADEYGTPKDLPRHVDESEKKEEPATKAADRHGEGPPMPMTHDEQVIDTFQAVSAALEKAERADLEKEAQLRQVRELIGEATHACIENGRIASEDSEKLAQALLDPVKALKVLIKVAAHRNVAEVSHLGQQVDAAGKRTEGRTKQASVVGSVDSPYCGARVPHQKPSDLALFRGLGLAVN